MSLCRCENAPKRCQEVFAETKWATYLPKEQGQPKAGEEPVLFIGVVRNLKQPNCDTDAGLAVSNMTLQRGNHGDRKLYHRRVQPAKAFGAVWIEGGSEAAYGGGIWLSIPYQQD